MNAARRYVHDRFLEFQWLIDLLHQPFVYNPSTSVLVSYDDAQSFGMFRGHHSGLCH